MRARNAIVLAGASLGVGAAAAGLYRSTHPSDALEPVAPEAGHRDEPITDSLFDMPPGLLEHDIATPDGGSVHAVEKGQGRPLVLLHGITLRNDVWAPQFNQLTDRYRVIAVDLRGHGASEAGSDGYGMKPLAADLATLLISLDLHDAVVVGHSMGGMTVMQFCADHPDVLAERVAGLVFVATRASDVVPPYLSQVAGSVVGLGQGRVDSGRDLPAYTVVTPRVARLAFGDAPSRRAVQIVAEMGQSMAPQALLPSVNGLLAHDARVALRATNTPSLVVTGTRDLLTPVPSGRHLAHLLPHSRFVVLPRAGHQLMQERPNELARLIDGFVAEIDAADHTTSVGR